MAAALRALDECTANLLDTGGFSRERQAAMTKLPEPLKPLTAYASPMDYPTDALTAHQSGANSARYRIYTGGRVSDRIIVETSNSRSLDKTLCKVAQRVRYKPALEKAGQPMESIGYLRIRWILG